MHTHSLLHVENTVVTCDCVAHRHQILWSTCVYITAGLHLLLFYSHVCLTQT